MRLLHSVAILLLEFMPVYLLCKLLVHLLQVFDVVLKSERKKKSERVMCERQLCGGREAAMVMGAEFLERRVKEEEKIGRNEKLEI